MVLRVLKKVLGVYKPEDQMEITVRVH